MSLPAGASIVLVARSKSALLPRQTLPTNTSSKAISRPVLLVGTLTSSTTTSTTTTSTSTSTSTSLRASVVSSGDVKTTSTTSAVSSPAADPTAKETTSASSTLLTTTTSSTEQSTVTAPSQTITSSQFSTSVQTTTAPPSTSSAQTAVVPPPLVSTDLSTIQTTTTNPSGPSTPPEVNKGLIATTQPTISAAISSDSSSTNTASSMVAVALSSDQTSQSSLSPVSTAPLPFPTKAAGENPAQPSVSNVMTTNTTPTRDVGPMIGGVIGGLAFIATLFFLWWRIHKKKRSRQSVFTPTVAHFHQRNPSEKYEIDGESLGPTTRSARWKAQTSGLCSRIQRNFLGILMTVKTRFVNEDDAPGIDLNRGNSQFLEPSPQHSRSNSTANQAQDISHARDAFGSRWNRLIEGVNFNWFRGKISRDPVDPFAETRRINEKDTYMGEMSPQFSPLPSPRDLNSDQKLQSRRSLSLGTFPSLTFPELSVSTQPTIPDLSRPPAVVTLNPFADPIDPTSPLSSRLKTAESIAGSQRTRGLSQPIPTGQVASGQYKSILATKATPTPRFPPSIRTSGINIRDSFVSPISASDREIKGRSDPFDLERTELRQPPAIGFMHNQIENVPVSSFSTKGISQGMQMQPRTEATQVAKHQRMVSDAPTYGSSKYSSGFSLLDHWRDPKATVEPLSWNKPPLQYEQVARNERTDKGGANLNDSVGMAL